MTSDRWIPSNYPITENIRAIYLTLEKLIQSEETQVNGIVILADYKGVSLSKASHFGPFIAKKVIGILQVWPLFTMYLFYGYFLSPRPAHLLLSCGNYTNFFPLPGEVSPVLFAMTPKVPVGGTSLFLMVHIPCHYS